MSEQTIQPPGISFPLVERKDSSDNAVAHQIFTRDEYREIGTIADPGFILDCGANVGYSSAYFLSMYPSSRVMAVESDPDNFGILERNLEPYGDRARCVHAGVWDSVTPLRHVAEKYRDGGQWSRQVRSCDLQEGAELCGMDIATLLDEADQQRISLLKMDIEGAEAVVFAGNLDWLDRVDLIVIELHDDSRFGNASEVFAQAMRDRPFLITESRKLAIARRQE